MTKRKAVDEQADLLPMKDITPIKKPIIRGHQAKTTAKAPSNPPSGGTSGRRQSRAIAPVTGAPPMQEGKSVLAIIADAASNPAVNPENMRALLDMQKEIMAEQSRRDFVTAFAAMQSDLPAIRQDGRIEIKAKDRSGERTGAVQQSTPYATFNAIMKVIRPILSRHGFTLSFATEPAGERIIVKGLLDHIGGHQRSTAFPLPAETSGSKNNVQGWGSSMSYGKRYATIALLNIVSEATEDRDDDGNTNSKLKRGKDSSLVEVDERPTISAAQADDIRELIEWCGVNPSKFLGHFGIKKIADLPVDLFESAKKDCKDYHANQQGRQAHG